MSILFQIYWINVTVEDSVVYIKGGGLQRSTLKIVSLLIVYLAIFRLFALRALTHNLVVKLPLLYYLATIVVVAPLIYSHAYFMAVNLLLFAPLLCVDFSGEKGEFTFEYLAKIITCVVCFQLVVDLILKVFELDYVRTVLGGMGNANTFGLHLIVAGLGLRFIFGKPLLSIILLLSTWGTGSLVSAGVGSVLVLQSLIIYVWKKPYLILVIYVSIILFIFNFGQTYLSGEFGPILHAYLKLKGFFGALFFAEDYIDVGSIKGRMVYTMLGIELLKDHPLAIIFGHPDFMPFFTGDGFYLALAVTLGVPMMALFLVTQIYMIFKGLREKKPASNFAAYVLFVLVLFFASNRILDYWPSGFIYMLVVSYLLRKKAH